MDTEAVSLFLALLAVVAELATLAAVVLAVGGRFSPALRALGRTAVEAVAPSALAFAFVVAAVCTGGSLYFSEVAHYPPCHLCWLQRYCMYPLVPTLGLAVWRRLPFLRMIAAALAAVGAAISTYHILVERGIVSESTSCDPTNPCSLIWVERLGYLTIPTMALSGFLLILTLLAVSRAGDRLDETSDLSRSELHGHR
ncbi:MAG TPA: disulfide bond formation protein B [Acidimicrobiia bacterium]|nr:disulfide bond formation protein B [Acidimicrobiia bacterium]